MRVHASDCAVHGGSTLPKGECNCSGIELDFCHCPECLKLVHADARQEGRKEIIDWIIKENGVYANFKGVIIHLEAGVWQAKLKEWDW